MSEAKETRAIAPIDTGEHGLALRTLDDIWRFSTAAVRSGFAPKDMTVEGCVVAIEMGLEIGMRPMVAIRSIAVINGRPCLWGDALLGLCKASRHFDHNLFDEGITGDGDAMVAHATVARRGCKPHTVRFSVADAKRANLWTKQGPWQQYPKRMLQLRARAFALRDTFPDVLQGFDQAEVVADYEQFRPATVVTSARDAVAAALAAPPSTSEPVAQPDARPVTPEPPAPATEAGPDDEPITAQQATDLRNAAKATGHIVSQLNEHCFATWGATDHRKLPRRHFDAAMAWASTQTQEAAT